MSAFPLAATEALALTPSSRVAAALFTVLLVLVNFALIGRCRLRQPLLNSAWFLTAFGALVLTAFPRLLGGISVAAGIADSNLALLLIVFALLFGLMLNLSLAVSRQATQIAQLAQRHNRGGHR